VDGGLGSVRARGGGWSSAIEAVQVHHLGPGGDEVLARTSPATSLTRRPRRGRAAASSSRRPGRRGCAVHLTAPVVRSRPSNRRPRRRSAVHTVPMSSRLTKKSLVSAPGRSVKTPCVEPPDVGVRARAGRRPARSSRARSSVSSCARSTSSSSAEARVRPLQVVAEAVGAAAPAPRTTATSVCVLRGVGAARGEGHRRPCARRPRRPSRPPAQPPSTIRSASETFLPPDCAR